MPSLARITTQELLSARLWFRAHRLAWTTRFRWLLRRHGGGAHGLDRPLVVSMTSYPPRFAQLPLTLMCLLSQTVRPDRLVLWIAEGDRAALTDGILSLQKHGLEIRYCPDLRSYKKILPALAAFDDCFVVTADDDVYYWPTWLEELVSGHDGNRHVAVCHRAHRIPLGHGLRPLSYGEWEYEIRERAPSPLNFPTGAGGVLYPPGSLHADVKDSARALALCPTADDVWLFWMLRRAGSMARRTAAWHELVMWPGSQATSLWQVNRTENDRQIAAMLAEYGFPGGEDAIRRC